jgi:hypothetical protein
VDTWSFVDRRSWHFGRRRKTKVPGPSVHETLHETLGNSRVSVTLCQWTIVGGGPGGGAGGGGGGVGFGVGVGLGGGVGFGVGVGLWIAVES